MHKTLLEIKSHLDALIAQVRAQIPNDEPFGIAHGNWSFPEITRAELVAEVQSIIDEIVDANQEEVGSHSTLLNDYKRRIVFLQQHTVPQLWGNSSLAVPAFMFTLHGLRNALKSALEPQSGAELAPRLRKLATQLRGMEARLQVLQPRTDAINSMVERIEHASEAADQLPADLVSLSEARQQIETLARSANGDHGKILLIKEEMEKADKELQSHSGEAAAVLKKCETAYSAATSVGLAAAFSERSTALSRSIIGWVGGLIIALIAGSVTGSTQLHTLTGLLSVPNASGSLIAINLVLAILSVGAPVWFSWLATKQIGQRFRLAEDYAYKASIARAYEGFRREAARFDKEMESRLLVSALDRLDELPLRLVEVEAHGSPWQELAASKTVRQALSQIPGFGEQLKELSREALDRLPLLRKASDASKATPE